MVSWVAAGGMVLIYLLQRGDKADPVIVLDRNGKVVRLWGKGCSDAARDPHRSAGNVWTTDAASSMVYKFSPEGKTLLQIEVGGRPVPCGNFCSTTDIAFASDGHLFIADGYRNARILDMRRTARRCANGAAPAPARPFRLPHSIQSTRKGVVYVADRETAASSASTATEVCRRVVATARRLA